MFRLPLGYPALWYFSEIAFKAMKSPLREGR